MALDADPGAIGTSAITEADLERLAAQARAATWVPACNAADAPDFHELCEALDLPADRASLAAVRGAHAPSSRRRSGGTRIKGRTR